MKLVIFLIGLIGFLTTLIYGISKADRDEETRKFSIIELIIIVIMAFGSWLGFIFLFTGYRVKFINDKHRYESED